MTDLLKETITMEALGEAAKALPAKRLPTSIIESIHCVVDGEPYDRTRSWKERLFSRPWRPLKRTEKVVPKVPMPGGYKFCDVLIVHPATMAAIKDKIDTNESNRTNTFG